MSEREPAPAAEIESGDGILRFRLHEDWTWHPAPGPDPPDDLADYRATLLEALREMGGRGNWECGVNTLHHTALAGAEVVFGKVVRWWGGHSSPDAAVTKIRAMNDPVGVA